MPMGNDPTPEGELERAFGVTSNAEELVASNRQRYSNDLRAALNKPVNTALSRQFNADPGDEEAVQAQHEVIAKLASAVDEDVQTASVHGAGAGATITYTYLDARGGIEKDCVLYAEVFGTAAEKRDARQKVAASRDPQQAGQDAAQAKLQEADDEARQRVADAEEQARQIIADAPAKAEKQIREATAKAEEDRQKASEDAAKAGDKAAEEATKAKQQAAKGK